MQPATNPEDIRTILGRFSAWAGKQSGNGHQTPPASEGVREFPYEEALRQLRGRRLAPTPAPESLIPESSAPQHAQPEVPSPAAAGPTAPNQAVPEAHAPSVQPSVALPPKPQRVKTVAKAASFPVRSRRGKSTGKPPVQRKKAIAAAGSPEPQFVPAPKKRAAGASAQPIAAPRKPKAIPAAAREKNRLEFRQVLTQALPPVTPNPVAKTGARKAARSERSLRITIRFTAEEEQQIQQSARALGLTASAWLRHRVLAAAPTAPIAAPHPGEYRAPIHRNESPADPEEPAAETSTPLGRIFARLRQILSPSRSGARRSLAVRA